MYNYNYYPYNFPRQNSFFSNFKNIKLSNILDGTQKTLSIINQAIPVIYQIKPLYQNAKTAFKVVNSFKNETKKESIKKENNRNITNYNNSPTYFL